MLLDCARLAHWRCAEDFDALFARTRDYDDWMCLALEPRETHRAASRTSWNDFDRLDAGRRSCCTTPSG